MDLSQALNQYHVLAISFSASDNLDSHSIIDDSHVRRQVILERQSSIAHAWR